MAPRKAYFELAAQPAMMTPYTPIEVSDSRYSRPASALDTTTVGDSGITAQAANAGISVITGASRNSDPVGLRRDDHFLHQQLEHVGERLADAGQQAEDAHAVRSAAQLHPADDLALPERQQRHAEDQRDGDHQDPHRGLPVVRQRRPGGVELVQHLRCPPLVVNERRAAFARALQRGRAAHHRVGLVHGHVGKPRRRCRPRRA